MASRYSIQRDAPRPGFDGVVVTAVPVWLNRDGRQVKYYDTRVEFDDGFELQEAQLFIRSYDQLPPGAAVRVIRSRSGQLQVVPEPKNIPEPERGASWRKPDIKTAIVGVVVLLVVIGAVVGAVLLYLQVSQQQVADLIKEGSTPSPTASPTPSTQTPSPPTDSPPATSPVDA